MEPTSVEIRGADNPSPADMDDLLDLLQRDNRLGARVRGVASTPPPDAMGTGVFDVLVATVASATGMTALTNCVVAWLKHRETPIRLTMTFGSHPSIDLDSPNIKRMSADELQLLIKSVAATMME